MNNWCNSKYSFVIMTERIRRHNNPVKRDPEHDVYSQLSYMKPSREALQKDPDDNESPES